MRFPTKLMNVTASVSLKMVNSIGIYLSILFRTASTSLISIDELVHMKLKMSSTRESWVANSVNDDKSSICNIFKAPSGSLTIVKRVCKMSFVVSGGLRHNQISEHNSRSRNVCLSMRALIKGSVRSMSLVSFLQSSGNKIENVWRTATERAIMSFDSSLVTLSLRRARNKRSKNLGDMDSHKTRRRSGS
jgi:hypothetical protein